jgi:hypothetical protein
VPQHLDQAAAPAAEDEQMPAEAAAWRFEQFARIEPRTEAKRLMREQAGQRAASGWPSSGRKRST